MQYIFNDERIKDDGGSSFMAKAPKISLPKINLPKFNLPRVDFSRLKFGKITKIEMAMFLIVGIIITFSIAVTLIISISLSSSHNDNTYTSMSGIGVNVLKADVAAKQQDLESVFKLWNSGTQMRNALKNGYVGTFAEIYDAAGLDENTFCMFTDAEGNIVWKSDNYKLATYDVSKSLTCDPTTAEEFDATRHTQFNEYGFYADENVPISVVFTAPVTFGGTMLLGVCYLGYDLSASTYLDSIKEQTGCEVALFGSELIGGTTIMNADGTRVTDVPLNADVAETVLVNEETFSGKDKIGKINYYSTYEPIIDIHGDACGAYFAGIPTSESTKAFNRMIYITVIIAVVIIVAAFIVVAFFLKRVIAKPIVAVSEIADNMSRGQLSVSDSDYKFRNDEVGDFARTLQNTKYSLSAYIQDISTVLNSMADGDFTAKPAIRYDGDFVQIEESFEQIQSKLADVVRNINESSEQVLTGAAQMANGSQMLAEGTTTQAGAIEELNSTITSIYDKTQVNAQHALHAKELSAGVEEKAILQNEDMRRVMDAMRDIESKSSQIGNIIQTIEDIAFQTNILALNAAVEAARAGDAGRGFAVVADEVRNLAEMSSEAAQNTTELISATVLAVNDGAELVRAAVESMNEITDKAKETSNLIDEISDASNAQAEAVQQVTVGIEKISEVVQQNSATAEETAASCEQLSGQSQILREQVSKLKA